MKLYLAVAALVFFSSGVTSYASSLSSALPMGTIRMGIETTQEETVEVASKTLTSNYLTNNTIVANVNSYVNIRESADVNSAVVGKLYKDSVGQLLSVDGEWLQIESGTVTGYVKSEYCYTGLEAEEKATEIALLIAKVDTETLRVREEADLESSIIALVPRDDELIVQEQIGDWYQVEVESGTGYVSKEYVIVTAEHVYAESIEEENARLAMEEAALSEAKKNAQIVVETLNLEQLGVTTDTLGSEIVEYAVQFVGNPYVYGGTDINNGIDCSGFTQYIYGQYGISLPRTSGSYKTVGASVGSIAEAQPGDIIVYSGHVAIYMGDNKIVHASNPEDGIKISDADYKTYISIRRII